MNVPVIVNDQPYGSERPYNALRLAAALSKREEVELRVFPYSNFSGKEELFLALFSSRPSVGLGASALSPRYAPISEDCRRFGHSWRRVPGKAMSY